MIYLHVPFCKQACSYCNFHFSTSVRGRAEVLAAMRREIALRSDEIRRAGLESIYLGGGTPSVLNGQQLGGLFEALAAVTHPPPTAEITLEANPDDLTPDRVAMLADSVVNRLSIGLQSFQEADLRYMNRAHTAAESTAAMQRVLAAGFTDLSVDLIYGSPTTSAADWDDNISRVLDFGVSHVSAYALTVEPRTALAHRIKTGQAAAPEDERFARQFDRLVERLTAAGYEHYEISNFAKPGHYSKHNSGYWQGKPYVGIGPSAHGFDGRSERYWNIANNGIYARLLAEATHLPSGLSEREVLSREDRYNEFVMTGLRTQWGVRAGEVGRTFGEKYRKHLLRSLGGEALACYFVSQNMEEEHFVLNQAGKRLADGIAAQAFWTADED